MANPRVLLTHDDYQIRELASLLIGPLSNDKLFYEIRERNENFQEKWLGVTAHQTIWRFSLRRYNRKPLKFEFWIVRGIKIKHLYNSYIPHKHLANHSFFKLGKKRIGFAKLMRILKSEIKN